MDVRYERFPLNYGDVSEVSEWGESERTDHYAPLRCDKWEEWHAALLEQSDLWPFVGGEQVVKNYSLMFIPPMSWPDKNNRGPAIGWPIYDSGKAVNVVRRFLDSKSPRYQGLSGRGIQIWPDVAYMDYLTSEILLVTGMRDASVCIAAGVMPTFTTTGGVNSWTSGQTNIEHWAQGHRFTVCFDIGEERWADHVADRLVEVGARSARVLSLSRVLGRNAARDVKDLADIAETSSITALRKVIRLGCVRSPAR